MPTPDRRGVDKLLQDLVLGAVALGLAAIVLALAWRVVLWIVP